MPFTPSHAVLALPFVRTPLVPAAIAVGAMTPDLPLFVRGFPLPYGRTHEFSWLPLTVLLALALLLVWRCVLRPAARELAPHWLAARLPEEWDAGAGAAVRQTFGVSRPPVRVSVRVLALLIVSLAIGVASHIIWDLFTHEGRWGSQVLPILDEQWGPLTGYKWLQHGSSAIGLGILAIWGMVWLSRRDAAASRSRVLPRPVRWAWWLSLPIVLVGAWVIGLALYGSITVEWTAQHLAYRVLPSACALWGLITLALAITVQALARRRNVRAR